MSKSSVGTNRLLHISDLPNSFKYSSSDIHKLLPVHFSTLRDNILTMIYYESHNFQKINLIHDPNLSLNSVNYSQVRGGWCEDFDNNQELSTSSHVNKCVEVGVVILNYLTAISQVNNKIQQKSSDDDPFAFKIITKAESFKKIEQSSSQTGPSVIKNIIKAQQKYLKSQTKTNKQFQSIDLNKEMDCFDQQVNSTITYNIYKKNKKYIFLTGTNQNQSQNFINILTLFRSWNLKRVGTQKLVKLDFSKLFRSNTYLQHLFTIARGFIFSSFQQKGICDPFIPLSNSNDNKNYLKMLLQYFDIEKDLQYSSQLIFQNLKQNEKEILKLLEDTIKVYKFALTYKLEDNQEEKYGFMVRVIRYFSLILCRILSQIPININVSYHFACKHNEKTNQLSLLMILNYKSSLSKHMFLGPQEINISVKNISDYLNKQSFEEIKKSERNIADEVFKNSYRIFNKYSEGIQKSQSKTRQNDLQEKFNILKIKSIAAKNLNFQDEIQRISQTKSNLKTNPTNFQEIKSKSRIQTSRSTFFSKEPGLSQIEVQYRNLINALQKRKENSQILNPILLKSSLRIYLQPFYQLNDNTVVAKTKSEKQSLNLIGLSCEFLTSDEISKLILKYEDSLDAICDFFMQENNFKKMVNVPIYFNRHLQNIFKSYISTGTNFKALRHSLIVNYLKKLIVKYHLKKDINQSNLLKSPTVKFIAADAVQSPLKQSNLIRRSSLKNSPSKLSTSRKEQNLTQTQGKLTEINMEQLLYLLQKKSYNCPQYKNLVLAHMKDIFSSKEEFSFLRAILFNFYKELLKTDHHSQLISSFIAELYFQIVYFTDQFTEITLKNSRYKKSLVDLKEKKFYQVIREGGLLNFGYQVLKNFIPSLQIAQVKIPYQYIIVSTIKIQKPTYFKSVVKMIENSFFSDNFCILGNYIKKKKSHLQAVNKATCMPFYRMELKDQIQNNLLNQQSQENEFNDQNFINIDLPQSGIFKQLLRLNPDIKIAGKNLRQEYSRKLKQIQQQKNKFTSSYFLDKIAMLNLDEQWEYIQLALQLLDKVNIIEEQNKCQPISTQSNHVSDDLLYVKQTFQHIYSKLSKIYQYITLSDIISQIKYLKTRAILENSQRTQKQSISGRKSNLNVYFKE